MGVKTDRLTEAVYLGDILREDGKNTSNIKSRVRKGLGIVSKIMNILETITFGSKYFVIAATLRQAELINGFLTNAEVWYGLSKAQTDELEEVDKLLLRRILNAPLSACVESLYLELGLIPINIIIKSRRILYLHYLLRLNKTEMLYKVFQAQLKYPSKDDWTEMVKRDLKDFKINLNLEKIKEKSAWSFKQIVKIKTKEYTLDYLQQMKQKHSKMKNLHYDELKIQNYLNNEEITVKEAQNIFRFRTRTANFKENYKNSYNVITCPLCKIQPDVQAHCVQCPIVKENINIRGNYKDIFTEKISKKISESLLKISEFRKKMIEKMSPVGGPGASLFDAADKCNPMYLFESG